ncbi:hypothetical protein [Paraburkholderia azotifigens]|uniref:Uncharacterized protein n=1 Tax=Paraburkholderia azotifigens TaxID=2057004 RepID=A0A5C6V424_9BURK|nr:hypothetical protein [Paraburkholderia azotifigens]TXC79540.1 hypothetical protein FRZ40_34755 [Paraburkholderia azotifigens]
MTTSPLFLPTCDRGPAAGVRALDSRDRVPVAEIEGSMSFVPKSGKPILDSSRSAHSVAPVQESQHNAEQEK